MKLHEENEIASQVSLFCFSSLSDLFVFLKSLFLFFLECLWLVLLLKSLWFVFCFSRKLFEDQCVARHEWNCTKKMKLFLKSLWLFCFSSLFFLSSLSRFFFCFSTKLFEDTRYAYATRMRRAEWLIACTMKFPKWIISCGHVSFHIHLKFVINSNQ